MEASKVINNINKIHELMRNKNIDIYLVFTSDYHMSEYVAPFFKEREYLSGFTGSAGVLVLTKTTDLLFTDGRYFVQAEKQLKGTGIALMKLGTKGVLNTMEYIEASLKEGETIAFDGRTISVSQAQLIENIAAKVSAKIVYDVDLVDDIWEDRPRLEHTQIYLLEEKYSGEATDSKLRRIREHLQKNGVDATFTGSLDEIAWIYNLRANDVENCPVAYAYSYITDKSAYLLIEENMLEKELKSRLDEAGVTVLPYDYRIEKLIKENKIVIDDDMLNYSIMKKIEGCSKLEYEKSYITYMKAIKNETEIENLRKAHLFDGIALTKFMYELKHGLIEKGIDEVGIGRILEEYRQAANSYIEPSFDTIAAYGKNAAMMHYFADGENNSSIRPEGMLLIDSGAQYLEGTTDVTRTYAVGEVTDNMKRHYTKTLNGMLRLAYAKFLYGCTGINLDILARNDLWQEGMDYRCGTGHGVGYMLNVHEGPNSIRWKKLSKNGTECVFEPGMVTTDEPGVYIENEYGIRIENELLCKTIEENEYGTFLGFEILTVVPIDMELVDISYMQRSDIERLNKYNKFVYTKLVKYMQLDEREWLENLTKPIQIER